MKGATEKISVCRLLCCFLLFTGGVSAYSQEFLLMHQMHEVPQSAIQNPSLIPPNKAHFNLLLPGITLSAGHNGFVWSDLFRRRQDDSLYLDFNQAIGQMNDRNRFQGSFRLEVLSFGLRLNKGYVSVFSGLRTDIHLNYDKKLFELLLQGNALYIGETIRLEHMKLAGTAWLEHSVGYAHIINESMQAGIRLKFLNGLANAHLVNSHLSLFTEASTHNLTLESHFLLHTSYPNEFERPLPSNFGFGIDLGFSWQVSGDLNIAAGINDLGRISWKDNLKSYRLADQTAFTFEGINMDELFGENNAFEAGMEALKDSLDLVFKPEEFATKYQTPLPLSFYLSANYHLSESGSAGAIMHFRYLERELIPAASLLYHYRPGQVMALTAALSYYNNSLANLGLGISLNLGFFQCYLLSGNILAGIVPQHMQSAGLQLGINFLID